MEPLEQEIAELIVSCTGLEDVRVDDIDPEAPLFVEGLGLDSIDALEIGVALNKRYGVRLTADSEDEIASTSQACAASQDSSPRSGRRTRSVLRPDSRRPRPLAR